MIIDSIIAGVSLILNTVHLAILLKFYKANNNITILIKLAISDLLRAVTVLVTSNCPMQNILLRNIALCTASSIINDVLIALTLASLTMAGIDRYLAVCKPFEYIENRFTIHFNKITMSAWSVITLIIIIQNSLISGSCVIGSKMCVMYSTEPIYLLYLVQAFLLCSASLGIISVCYIKIFTEFYSMLGKLQSEAVHTKRMSIVVGTITILFFMLYLPLLFGIIAVISGNILGYKTWTYLYSLLTVHGIVNAITYSWQKKRYRKYLRSLFCCENKVNSEMTLDRTGTRTTT